MENSSRGGPHPSITAKAGFPLLRSVWNSFLRRPARRCWVPRQAFRGRKRRPWGCLERVGRPGPRAGEGQRHGPSGASVEQGFYRRLTVREPWSRRFPVSDLIEEASYYFQPAGGFDQPRFRFQFTFNRYISDYNVMQAFTTAPSYTHNDRFRPNDLSAAYFGNSGSLLMPGQTMLNNTVSFGWRSGDNSVSEQYWGLSNTIEPEHPLFGYITEFKRPFNPLRFNTVFPVLRFAFHERRGNRSDSRGPVPLPHERYQCRCEVGPGRPLFHQYGI